MEFRQVLALRGPNVWAKFPVLEAWVDLKELKDSPSDELPGFNERLMSWLPTMIEHRCSIGERGGFFERLRRGTYQAHILEHTTLELQSLAGCGSGYGRARETSEDGVYKVVVEYQDETVCRACMNEARELLNAAVHNLPYDVNAAVERLRSLAQDICLGPSTRSIVKAAEARGIPYRRLNSGSLVTFGYGSKQRRILAAETDNTGAIAESIAQDKELTKNLLQAVGVPVPEGRPVESAEDAWEAACDIGVPVVVKPQKGNQGRGVATNLNTREQVVAAYEAALQEESTIIVEKYAPGADYRLLVVGNEVVAAARREPAQVVGDGIHTISQLIDVVNTDPRRGEDHATALSKIRLDPVAMGVLSDQGLTPESVPAHGRIVCIRRNANLSTGGTAADVTDRVHPQVAARAVDAAKMVGLDIAGVDVVAVDIGRPLEEQGGVIVEVNAAPGLRMHVEPSAGTARPVGDAIVGTLFPPGDCGRIPIVAVTGVNGKTTTTRFIASMFKRAGRTVGMTCTEGIYVGDRRIESGDCSGPASARKILLNPQVDAAVFETARGGILRAGLGFDLCDVAVVTNIGEGDHLGLHDIHTLEKLAVVKRCCVESVSPTGTAVLKADDPLVAAMAEYCEGSVTFFARASDDPVIAAHRAKGGRAVFVRNDEIVLAEGPSEITLLPVSRVPLTRGGLVGFMVENTLASIAAGWAVGLSLDVIRECAELFAGDLDTVPGRFNLFEINGATVIVDYGHNVSALQALLDVVQNFPHTRRSVVYTAAGDRRDCDLIRQGEMLGSAFDCVILYEDHYTRGRQDGEIMGLIRQGLASGSRVKDTHEVRGAVKSLEFALEIVQQGELLLIQADEIDETVDFIREYLKKQTGRERLGGVSGARTDATACSENCAQSHAQPGRELVGTQVK
jgi:cyanophycin synthetase